MSGGQKDKEVKKEEEGYTVLGYYNYPRWGRGMGGAGGGVGVWGGGEGLGQRKDQTKTKGKGEGGVRSPRLSKQKI